jgi:hypothetical protein
VKSIAGIDTVKVSLEKGVASITLKPQNTVTMQQLHEAVVKNGFTMKQCSATVVGTLQFSGAHVQLKVSGSNDVLSLQPDTGAFALAPDMAGKTVLVMGILPEGDHGATPTVLRYQRIEAQ